ncbi:hypothetical protein [Mycolicibacter icosiumassiliensis]|uniref:hypothetical protein n=1 Tax=Mycolicibacter icosiumassiliensis TaxID=1792835 RepID=UPI0012B6AAF2|nr:hypothetical protein [Mycolicibacter icosiumassiliensis]
MTGNQFVRRGSHPILPAGYERLQATVAEHGVAQPERVVDKADRSLSGTAEARSVMGVDCRLATKVKIVCRFDYEPLANGW